MTTRITVTTGDGGLLERNAQQQAANRQGTLVKGQAEQAAATGAQQQRQRRIASGLDPATGRPLPSTGSTSRLTRIDQEPAAFRSTKGLGSFYFKSRVDTGNIRVFVLRSGDGAQTVELSYPLKPTAPGDSISIPSSTSETIISSIGNPCGVGSVSENYFYIESRSESYSGLSDSLDNERQFVFPLNEDKAIFVAAYSYGKTFTYRKTVYITKVHRTGITTVGGQCALGAEIPGTFAVLQDTIDYITYSPYYTETHIKCAIVGHKEARSIPTPAALEQALKQTIFQEIVEGVEPSDGYPEPEYDSSIVTAEFINYFPTQGDLFNYYGITDEGSITNVASPLAWIALDSFRNGALLENISTHEAVINSGATLNGRTIPDYLKPSEILGLVPAENKFLQRSDNQYLQGSLSQKNYPYSGPGWAPSSVRLQKPKTWLPEDGYGAPTLIYPWGETALCRQQAARYGISA